MVKKARAISLSVSQFQFQVQPTHLCTVSSGSKHFHRCISARYWGNSSSLWIVVMFFCASSTLQPLKTNLLMLLVREDGKTEKTPSGIPALSPNSSTNT